MLVVREWQPSRADYVPLRLYFNERGRAKMEIARGKTLHDKRETERKRSWEREKGTLLRVKG